MKCPFCGHLENRVVNSRTSTEGDNIRRRRECLKCNKRFTTYERIDHMDCMVIKKDNRREPFDREKIIKGLVRACNKRPIDSQTLQSIADEVETWAHKQPGREVTSAEVGLFIVNKLKEIDEVAYVRFASVYRQFKDISQFVDILETIKDTKN